MNLGYIMAFITLLIVAPVGLAIGATVTFEVTGAIDTETDSYAENAIADIEANTDTGYSLGSLMPLVIAAVALITILIAGFLGMRMRA
jgi:hypothetical protein